MFQIREANLADVSGIADVHIKSWHATYRGIVADDFIDNLTPSWSEQRWTKVLRDADTTTLIYVATNQAERIVGFAVGGRERDGDPNYDAELYAIYLLKECQGQGVGRRLVSNVARGLLGQSLNSMLVWALKDNYPARKFYTTLNGKAYRRRMFDIGGISYADVSYGWDNLSSLICD
ncbi:GNAT family N-acetyltransferase [Alicyclobacillus fodiniaquatilis]|uniref:GNAT family N-acetyltransferase n=1 Tax=Alicyclobacillus fodiniaquatilis TaxID=1661150 RepID=A0ABW4JET2_9BACL